MLQLVVAGYGVPYALMLVLGGRLGDLFGRRRCSWPGWPRSRSSRSCAASRPTRDRADRLPCGAGRSAAFMVPQVLATIQSATSGQARARAIGLYGATAGIAAVVGQVAGGLIVNANIAGTGWRLIFLVNVPVGIVGALRWRTGTCRRRARRSRRAWTCPARPCSAAALLALLVPLTEGRTLGWPAWSLALLALVVPGGAAFVAVERRLERTGRHPLVPPSLLRDRGHAGRPRHRRALLRRLRGVHVRVGDRASDRRAPEPARLGNGARPAGAGLLRRIPLHRAADGALRAVGGGGRRADPERRA